MLALFQVMCILKCSFQSFVSIGTAHSQKLIQCSYLRKKQVDVSVRRLFNIKGTVRVPLAVHSVCAKKNRTVLSL